ACVARVVDELAIVQPKIVVVMGEDALAALNDLDVPLSKTVAADPGVVQPFTPACEALFTPNIDDSLDEEAAKRAFWSAFRVLGGLLLVVVLDAARAGAAASPFEALLWGCAGVAFAALLDAPGLAVALPVFVGVLDLSGVVGAGPGALLVSDPARPGDPFTVE